MKPFICRLSDMLLTIKTCTTNSFELAIPSRYQWKYVDQWKRVALLIWPAHQSVFVAIRSQIHAAWTLTDMEWDVKEKSGEGSTSSPQVGAASSKCWLEPWLHFLSKRRNKKERQAAMEGSFDDFLSLNKQLGTLGLSLKQIPGGSKKILGLCHISK